MKIKIKDAKPFLREGDAFKTKSFPGDICTFLGCPCNLMSRRPGFDFTMYDDEEIDLLPPIRGRICDLFPYLKVGHVVKISGETFFLNHNNLKKDELCFLDKGVGWYDGSPQEIEIISEPEDPIVKVEEMKPDEISYKKYRKRPLNIKAKQIFSETSIDTPEGIMKGNPGDYEIIGIKGERYICKKDIFEESYDEIEQVLTDDIQIPEPQQPTNEEITVKETKPIRIKLKDAKDILKPGMRFTLAHLLFMPILNYRYLCYDENNFVCKKEYYTGFVSDAYVAFPEDYDKFITILPEEKQQEATTEQPSTTETKCDHDYECTQCESFRCKKCGNVLVPIQMLLEIFNRLKKLGGV